MCRALGKTPEEAVVDGIDALQPHMSGAVGLLLTNREPAAVQTYLSSLANVDFARAGAVAPRTFALPAGPVLSTGGEVPAEHDVPLGHTLEPELRKLGIPTRMVRGKIVLGDEDGSGEGYTVCRAGDVLDSRQTRLLKLFSVCMSEFSVKVKAYWSAASGEVTVVDAAEETDAEEKA
jgi:mRNA turnover protein 4